MLALDHQRAPVAERHQPEVGLAPEQRHGQAAAAAGLAGAGPADRAELAEALVEGAVDLDALPLGSTGKLDRSALKAMAAAGMKA